MHSLTDLPWLVLVWLSKHRKLDGLDVCVAGSDIEVEEVFDKVDAALRLIASNAPTLNREIQCDVKHILLTEASGGHYLAGIETCRIGIDYARKSPAIELAMMIIHEATHARLDKVGHHYSGEQREQIERACVDAEISFAERIPGSDDAIKRVRRLLETRWWEIGQNAEYAAAELIARGVPVWLAKRLVRRSAQRSSRDYIKKD